MAKTNSILKPTCSAQDCNATSSKRGMCDKHYRRLQRYGTLELTRQPPGSVVMQMGYETQLIDGEVMPIHIRNAEIALGKKLPRGAIVHHANENKMDNRNENLVICPSRAYHNLIHARLRAYEACGHADWLKCSYCKVYDDPENGTVRTSRNAGHRPLFYHKKCAADNAKGKI